MRRGGFHASRRVVANPSLRRDWEEYDPRIEEYYDPGNLYTSGPGLHLPPENLPYSIKTSGLPFRLFVNGIHAHTTEEGIRHIFCNYGKPLSVYRTRNKHNNPIAFVEFETQIEADNAIIELDGKPPLNWEVSYAIVKNDERMYQKLSHLELESDYERQTPLFAASGSVRHIPCPRPSPNFYDSHASMEIEPVRSGRDATIGKFPLCALCKRNATLVCTVCKTRYCSPECQSSDWPTHRNICRPPPALEPASGNFREHAQALGAARSVSAAGFSNASYAPFARNNSRAVNGCQQLNTSNESASPHSYMIRGIHPLEQALPSNQKRPSVETARNANLHLTNSTQTRSDTKETCGLAVQVELNRAGERTVYAHSKDRNGSIATSVRSPSWEKDVSPQSNMTFSCSPSKINSKSTLPSIEQRKQDESNSTLATSKVRNYPLANLSPKTVVASPPQKTQQPVVTRKFAKEYSIKKLKPLLTKPTEILVCFSKSPDEFYIQFGSFREILQKLMIDIQDAALQSDAMLHPVEGMPCLAIFHADRTWYRAQVIKILPDGIGVRYVDFGNTSKMPNSPDNFRLMELELSESPFFAIKAKLADVFPLNGNGWQPNVKLRFGEMVMEKWATMELVQMEGDVMCVRLKSEDGDDVASKLVREGLARKATPNLEISDELDRLPSANGVLAPPQLNQGLPLSSKVTTPVKTSTPPKTVASEQKTQLVVSPLPAQLPGSTTSPTRAALRNTSTVQPRAPLSPVASPQIHSKSPSVATSTSPARQSANSIINALEIGESVIFSVTINNGCDQFIGTIVRANDAEVLEFHSVMETLGTLQDFKPTVGSVVAALSIDHGQWFRAYVEKVENSTISVLYVDYGNREDVVSVRPIPPNFQNVELAVNMTSSKNLSTSAKLYLEENMILESAHQIEIVSKKRDGNLVAKFVGEDIPTFLVNVESWRSLLAQPVILPISSLPTPVDQPAVSMLSVKEAQPVSLQPREIVPLEWNVGFSCDVMPFVAENVDCIYVQSVTEETVNSVTKLQEELNSVFRTSPKLETIPDVGTFVAAIFPVDEAYYRAKITEINGESITLFYIDYGNSYEVSLDEIRALPENLYEYPAFCKRISLALVPRLSGPLPAAAEEILSGSLCTIFNMIVLPSSSGQTECTLTKDGVVLNEVLANLLNQSSQDTAKIESVEMPKLEAADPEPISPSEGPTPVDNTLGNFSYGDGPFLDLPEEGSFKAVVLNVEGPQIIMLRAENDEISAKLIKLEEEMTSYAESVLFGHTPTQNEICIARFPDGKWYRAACVEVVPDPSGTQYICVQVDFGQLHTIDVDWIRRIPERFVTLMPYLAQQTILEGTESMEQVSAELVNRVSNLLPVNSSITTSVLRREETFYIVSIPEVSAVLSKEGLL